MQYSISKKNNLLEGRIVLPASKSISNRVQIINALSYNFEPIKNLSDCDDSKAMQSILNSNTNSFDVGHAGTTMRFLTAYLSKIVGEWTLTGSHRMKERPIGVLVDALNSIGAQITYLEKEGYPPLKIFGSNLTGEVVELKGNTSSQYITALLLIAPSLEKGLRIKLSGKIVSRSYIEMTLNIMEEFGIKSEFKGQEIFVPNQAYQRIPYIVEGDWSGASYWFAFMALADEGKLYLDGLRRHSFQGDSGLVPVFEKLGVKAQFSKRGMFIEKMAANCTKLKFDFNQMPDLAQTFAVCACLKNIPFHFTGLETLKIKETDRIYALITELGKLGYILTEPAEGELAWNGERKTEEENIVIETYHDHRMAMAFAPIALARPNVVIDSTDVVKKSYPNFWEQLKELGFEVKE
ncbi:3-phosphoshikimate 1-carboxyvinyltransferase [Labilibaculum euxinus]|uniref:3-phosphoshikimate 1-carboxyvinyltransferase n=1 Tax=Labilibaculum euxinus TaxID=2686357 RepID=A0A7M4D9G4_9BACT|nr:3-phosphoshikimate 1-carboxyvinyltransferase [Labilibaculum euxinus]MUP39293.1 3-phosphoshikimate 1-carboxyvinyltransferase [Labilibaculum euxinus]MVB08498.1 3-phosphoshikimate 1-carboxyvinyltransferase [Labilibaculum euxinus]